MNKATVITLSALAAFCPGALQAQDDAVSFGVFYKPVCDAFVAGFAKSTAAQYGAWVEAHRDAVRKLEADPDFQARRKEALVPPPAEFAATKLRQLQPMCEKAAGVYEIAAPADARYASAEKTWETFRTALREANREVVFASLAGNARKVFAGRLHAMTDDQLKRMDAAIAELKLNPSNGAFQEGMILQKDGTGGTVVFVRVGANWKIGEM